MMRILDLIFPPKCICCSELLELSGENRTVCGFCLAKWEMAKARCRAEAFGQPVKTYSFANGREPGQVLYLVGYTPGEKDSVEDRIILNLKNNATRRIVEFAASELADVINAQVPYVTGDENTLITWIPRRRSSVRRYGFDHMERVADALSRMLNVPFSGILKRRTLSAEQKTLTHSERRQNAERSMYISDGKAIVGKRVLLIDDIVTSGASIDMAESLLYGAGAEQVVAITLSATEPPKDKPRAVEDVFNIIKKSSM